MLGVAAVGLAVALLLSGAGSSPRPLALIGPFDLAHITPPSPTALRFSTASNRRLAYKDTQKLIKILELPPGARLVAKVPPSLSDRFARTLPGTAVTRRVWIVHEPLDRVVRFVRTHAHPRPRPEAHFRGTNNGVLLHTVGSYVFPPAPGRSWERWLNVDMVGQSGGRTAVVAQAADAWVRERPRSALLPARVRRIDVVSRVGSGRPNVLVHVRRPYDVGSIVALVNGLGATEERVLCLDDYWGGPTVTLRFRAANGKLLARATVPDALGRGQSGPCNPVQLSVHGQKATPLIGADLVVLLQQQLGINLAPLLPRDVSSCLQRRGWKVRSMTRDSRPELSATKHGMRRTVTFHYSGKITADRTTPAGFDHCVHARPPYVIFG